MPRLILRAVPITYASLFSIGERRRSGTQCHAGAGCCRNFLQRAPVGNGQGIIETAPIPESRLRAADAAMAGLDGKAGAVVPLHGGAGVVGDWPLAPQLVQTPPLPGALIAEAFRKLSALVEGALEVRLRFEHEKYDTHDWALDHVSPATVPQMLTLGAQPYRHNVNVFGFTMSYQFDASRQPSESAEKPSH